MAFFVTPMLWIFLRNRPEDFGLLPDGEPPHRDGDDSGGDFPSIIEENWELREALRTPILWVFIFARMLAGAWGTALIFHQISIFGELGYEASVAANTHGQAAVMTAVATLAAGWLIDRIRPHYMIAIHMGG